MAEMRRQEIFTPASFHGNPNQGLDGLMNLVDSGQNILLEKRLASESQKARNEGAKDGADLTKQELPETSRPNKIYNQTLRPAQEATINNQLASQLGAIESELTSVQGLSPTSAMDFQNRAQGVYEGISSEVPEHLKPYTKLMFDSYALTGYERVSKKSADFSMKAAVSKVETQVELASRSIPEAFSVGNYGAAQITWAEAQKGIDSLFDAGQIDGVEHITQSEKLKSVFITSQYKTDFANAMKNGQGEGYLAHLAMNKPEELTQSQYEDVRKSLTQEAVAMEKAQAPYRIKLYSDMETAILNGEADKYDVMALKGKVTGPQYFTLSKQIKARDEKFIKENMRDMQFNNGIASKNSPIIMQNFSPTEIQSQFNRIMQEQLVLENESRAIQGLPALAGYPIEKQMQAAIQMNLPIPSIQDVLHSAITRESSSKEEVVSALNSFKLATSTGEPNRVLDGMEKHKFQDLSAAGAWQLLGYPPEKAAKKMREMRLMADSTIREENLRGYHKKIRDDGFANETEYLVKQISSIFEVEKDKISPEALDMARNLWQQSIAIDNNPIVAATLLKDSMGPVFGVSRMNNQDMFMYLPPEKVAIFGDNPNLLNNFISQSVKKAIDENKIPGFKLKEDLVKNIDDINKNKDWMRKDALDGEPLKLIDEFGNEADLFFQSNMDNVNEMIGASYLINIRQPGSQNMTQLLGDDLRPLEFVVDSRTLFNWTNEANAAERKRMKEDWSPYSNPGIKTPFSETVDEILKEAKRDAPSQSKPKQFFPGETKEKLINRFRMGRPKKEEPTPQ